MHAVRVGLRGDWGFIDGSFRTPLVPSHPSQPRQISVLGTYFWKIPHFPKNKKIFFKHTIQAYTVYPRNWGKNIGCKPISYFELGFLFFSFHGIQLFSDFNRTKTRAMLLCCGDVCSAVLVLLGSIFRLIN